jgi:hypothetical protein
VLVGLDLDEHRDAGLDATRITMIAALIAGEVA